MKYSVCVVYFLCQGKREEVLQAVCDLWKVQLTGSESFKPISLLQLMSLFTQNISCFEYNASEIASDNVGD